MKTILLILGCLIVGFFLGRLFGIGNQTAEYSEDGYPVNCRALIADNIKGYSLGDFTAEDALNSIDRNCGRFGIIWHVR